MMNVGLDASTLLASVKREGEKFHNEALELARMISVRGVRGVSSALVHIEVPGALSSATSMPIEKVYEVTASLMAGFSVDTPPFEGQVERATEMMLDLRSTKRKAGIGSADFHYLSTAYNHGCRIFITTDEKHLLRQDFRKAVSSYLEVVNPKEALERLPD